MRLLKLAARIIGFIAAIVALATFPILIQAKDGRLALDLAGALARIGSWAAGLLDGSSFVFRNGPTTWSFFELLPKFSLVTFLYLLVPGALGVGGGFFAGLLHKPGAGGKAEHMLRAASNAIFAIPDFVFAILVQLLVVLLVDLTGQRTFKISYDASGGLLLALPLTVMTVYPFIYSYRMTLRTAARANSAYFVVNARARGLPERSIRFKHIGSAVLAALSTDLPSVLAIMMTSVFVVEYSFSLPGLTRWLFTVGFTGSRRAGWFDSYQFPLAIDILFCLAAAYFLVLLALKGLLRAIKGTVIHAL